MFSRSSPARDWFGQQCSGERAEGQATVRRDLASCVTRTPDNCWISEVQVRLLQSGKRNWQDFPWRRSVPFWLALLAEVLLQRTRARQVAPVFEALRGRFRTARALQDATTGELRELFAPVGLNWRIDLLVQLATELGRRGGRVQRSPDALQELPGVGPYAAAAALSLHAGTRAVIVDANVVRVLCRLTGQAYDGETRRKGWLLELADRLTPAADFREYNYALLDHAMLVCTPRNPRCVGCPLSNLCCEASAGNQDGRES